MTEPRRFPDRLDEDQVNIMTLVDQMGLYHAQSMNGDPRQVLLIGGALVVDGVISGRSTHLLVVDLQGAVGIAGLAAQAAGMMLGLSDQPPDGS